MVGCDSHRSPSVEWHCMQFELGNGLRMWIVGTASSSVIEWYARRYSYSARR